jgi:hypothetical protein
LFNDGGSDQVRRPVCIGCLCDHARIKWRLSGNDAGMRL